MAYVYNQQNQDEQQQQSSNIFAPQQQDGQGLTGEPVQKTTGAGVGMPLGGAYRGQERSPTQVTEQARQQRQARLPLQEIYRRNQPSQVEGFDFSKTAAQIKGAQDAAQEAAAQYKTSQLGRVESVGEEDISKLAGGEEAPTQKAMRVLSPQQANLSEAFKIATQVPSGLEERFGTGRGLVGEVMKEKAVPSQTRGTAALDVSMLQKTPEFQQSRQAILASGKAAQKKQQELLQDVPEQTRKDVQAAIDASRAAAKTRITGEAGKYETAAQTARDAYDKARGDIQAALNTGQLTPQMAQMLTDYFDKNIAGGFTDTGTRDYLRGFLAQPNREATLRQNLAEMQSVGQAIPQYFPSLTYDPTTAFRAQATPQELTSFMGEEQYTPYSRLKSLLGEAPVRGMAAPTSPLEMTAGGQTDLGNYLAQAAALRSGAQAAQTEYGARKTAVQQKLDELKAVRDSILEKQQTPIPGQITLPYQALPEYVAKQAEVEKAFNDQTAKFSPEKREQLRKELGLNQALVQPPNITEPVSTPEWEKIVASMKAPQTSQDAQNYVPGQLSFPIFI